MGARVADDVIKVMISRISTDNYLFFSITKINYQTSSATLGIGILGRVYTTGKLEELVRVVIYEFKTRSK